MPDRDLQDFQGQEPLRPHTPAFVPPGIPRDLLPRAVVSVERFSIFGYWFSIATEQPYLGVWLDHLWEWLPSGWEYISKFAGISPEIASRAAKAQARKLLITGGRPLATLSSPELEACVRHYQETGIPLLAMDAQGS